jgi:hypothetical protein
MGSSTRKNSRIKNSTSSLLDYRWPPLCFFSYSGKDLLPDTPRVKCCLLPKYNTLHNSHPQTSVFPHYVITHLGPLLPSKGANWCEKWRGRLSFAELPWSGAHAQTFLEIQKQRALGQAEGPELQVKEITEGLWINVAGIKAFADVVLTRSEQAAKSYGCVWLIRGNSERRGIFLARFQCLIYSGHLQGLSIRRLYYLTFKMMIKMTGLQFMKKFLLLKLSSVFQILYLFKLP